VIARTGGQVERVVHNALGTWLCRLEIFCANNGFGKLAFGYEIVLRTRRSTLGPFYV
jgi:hypothetical protein